ncbi:DUF2807 domain-containing protein [Hymenobacter sp. BT664]|uniref:DUF2807 domain-containing protein n=1 Tax=Hymenobacter montanus TaxID=2771359 RepID=A0A927BH19_9BACT|nr:head GIN domain-containing protein [Hymenobacter montanus]MBD2769862.1 DUF2807 domain-containing protein [Hymenobacter montanus]
MKNPSFLRSFLFVLCSTLLLTSCGEKGKGDIVTRQLTVPAFEGVNLRIVADVVLTEGATQKVEVRGQENIINRLKTAVDNGTWEIEFDNRVSDYDKLTVYVTLPRLRRVVNSGSGSIQGLSTFTTSDLSVNVNGSGNTVLATTATTVDAGISGSGNIELSGSTPSQSVRISGSGSYRGFGLRSDQCEVSISGSGQVEVTANTTLRADIAGSGNVRYKGRPSINATVSGSGRVINSN